MTNTNHEKPTDKPVIGNFIFDLNESRFKQVDFKALSLKELKENDLSPTVVLDLIHPEDYQLVSQEFAAFKNACEAKEVRFRIRAGGNERWIRVTAWMNEKKANLVYGSVVDITAFIEKQHLLEKYTNKKNAVLNVLAHDLAGPLNVANMLISTLKHSLKDTADLKLVESILNINKQSIELIRQLTDREFLEVSNSDLNKTRVNISRVVSEYIEEYQKSSAETNRKFEFPNTQKPIFLNVDQPKFIQILNNLITNALKFTDDNGVINVNIEEKDHEVLFKVKDNGIGIPEEYHGVLFDKFTEASRKGLQGEPSIGMGMYVVKNIVDWHGGKVWVKSKQNAGTTICFTLPKGEQRQ